MYLTLQLILSHFLADYPLQPGGLVKFKYKKMIGVISHAIVHLVLMVVLCMPFLYLQSVRIGISIIFVTHIIVDFIKITLDRNYQKINKFVLYVADQVIHLAIMLYCGLLVMGQVEPSFSGVIYSYLSDKMFLSFLLVLTLTTYFYDVTKWTYLNSFKSIAYKRDYRTMLRNAVIVLIAYGAYWIFK